MSVIGGLSADSSEGSAPHYEVFVALKGLRNLSASSSTSLIGYPDYANAIDLTKENGTVSANGWLHFQGANNTYEYTITINGFEFKISDAYGTTDELLVPVKSGDTYTCSQWSYISNLKYLPNR